jgi:hypothetical protein
MGSNACAASFLSPASRRLLHAWLVDRQIETLALDIRADRIAAIYVVRNPDKLTHIARTYESGPQADGATELCDKP